MRLQGGGTAGPCVRRLDQPGRPGRRSATREPQTAHVARSWSRHLVDNAGFPGFRPDDNRLTPSPMAAHRRGRTRRRCWHSRIERLADHGAEIDEAIEQDVGEREALAAEIVAAVGDLPVRAIAGDWPRSSSARARLPPRRNPLLEELQPLAEAIAVGERLADVEVDPPRPHPAFARALPASRRSAPARAAFPRDIRRSR